MVSRVIIDSGVITSDKVATNSGIVINSSRMAIDNGMVATSGEVVGW
jgi:hypothetical protein